MYSSPIAAFQEQLPTLGLSSSFGDSADPCWILTRSSNHHIWLSVQEPWQLPDWDAPIARETCSRLLDQTVESTRLCQRKIWIEDASPKLEKQRKSRSQLLWISPILNIVNTLLKEGQLQQQKEKPKKNAKKISTNILTPDAQIECRDKNNVKQTK